MAGLIHFWKKTYDRFFYFLASNRLKAGDLDSRKIHFHLVIVLITSPIMWAYAVLAHFAISPRTPAIIGYMASTIHMLSPLMFRYTGNTILVSTVIILPAMVHITSFCYYSGGFTSHCLIWLGIIPLFASLSIGKKGAIFWSIFGSILAGIYLYLYLMGYPFPDVIGHPGHLISHAILVFGWLFLTTATVISMLNFHLERERLLHEQGARIDELFRVLFHDLANPLGRISIGLNISKRGNNPEMTNRGLEIALQATDSMLDITQSVRKMYAIRKGKAPLDLSPMPLIDAVNYVKDMFASELAKKCISIQYEDEGKNPEVIVDSITFKNQVLANIISNAIKFSSERGIIKVNAVERQNSFVVVDITDQGIGMPQSILDHLFDVSKKTSRQGTNGEVGSGFGMNIMKSFVELYQGKVSVTSRERSKESEGFTTVRLLLREG